MKIALIMGAFSFGGTERVVCELANGFSSVDYAVSIITMERREVCYSVHSTVHIINGIEANGNFKKLKQIVKLRRIIKDNCFDIVVSFMTHINLATILAATGTKCKVVVSERNSPADMPRSKVQRIFRKILYPLANGYVFQTSDAQNYFSNDIVARSIVIPNPIFLEASIQPFAERKKEIVSVGRLMQQKDQITILKAFEIVHQKYDDYILKIYGEGPEHHRLQEYINDHGLEGSVVLCGTSKTVQRDISSAKIFLLSSKYEGMPNALMEAMSLGLVCVSTDCPCGGPKMLIEDGVNGFLCEIGNSNGMAEIIESILPWENLMEQISREAAASVKKYNLKDTIGQWIDYIAKVKNIE